MSEIELISFDEDRDFLGPILEDSKAQESEHRVRKNPLRFKSVHPADVLYELEKGWEVQREGKSKTRLKRRKAHDQWLKDRVWCLLYKMGYQKLERFR